MKPNRAFSVGIAAIAAISTASAAHAAPAGVPVRPLPPLAAARPLALPRVTESTLPNGLRLVVLEDHRQPALWMRMALPAGTVRDPEGKVGLSSMVAELLNKGTTTRTEARIAGAVDSLGATLGAGAEPDYLIVSANGLSRNADALFDLMADVVLHPTFPQDEIDRYKIQTLSAIQADLGNPGSLAGAALRRLVYGAFPYGNYAMGTPDTLKSLTAADVKGFYDTYFAPNGATLFFVGDITPAQAAKLATRHLGGWEKKTVPAPPAPPDVRAGTGGAAQPRITVIDRPGAQQTEIRIGTLTTGYSDPERVPGTVATAVLGLGQFEGRLTKEIRVKRGLTYGASSSYARNKSAGEFVISTFTKNASTGEVVKIALDETAKLRATEPPAAELADRKAFLNGSFAVSVASPDDLLFRLTYAVLYGKGPGDLTLYTPRVNAVTPLQVRQVLNKLSLDPVQVVLVGDAKAIQPQLTGIGPVTVIEPADLDLLAPNLTKAPATAPVPAAAPGVSQNPAERAAIGQALLLAAIKAHGGDSFLALKSITASGKGDLRPPGLPITVHANTVSLVTESPDRARVELQTSFGPVTVAAPGGGKDLWYQVGGEVHDVAAGTLVGDPTVVLREAVAHHYAVEDAGMDPATDGGAALHQVAVTDAAGHVTRIFLDGETNLLRRVLARIGDGAARFDLSDYKLIGDGISLPKTIISSLNGQKVLSLNLDTFALNQVVDDKRFVRPAE